MEAAGDQLSEESPVTEMQRQEKQQWRNVFRWLLAGPISLVGLLGSAWANKLIREHGSSGEGMDVLRTVSISMTLLCGGFAVILPFALLTPFGRWLLSRQQLRRLLEDSSGGVVIPGPAAGARSEQEASGDDEDLKRAFISRSVEEAYRNESWWFLCIWLRLGSGFLAAAGFCVFLWTLRAMGSGSRDTLLEDPLRMLVLISGGASLLIVATTPLRFVTAIVEWVKATRRRRKAMYPRDHPDLREIS